MRRVPPSAVAGILVVALGTAPAVQSPPAGQPDANARVNERLRALRQEADALAAREKTLLVELRRLELERDIQVELQHDADAALADATTELADTTTHLQALEQRQEAELPGLRNRLVELYKLGSGGYLRLLLSVDDVRDLGRAYRTVAALAALDRQRVRAHESTVRSLRDVTAELEARRQRAAAAEAEARRATAAASAAVAAHNALISQIDARRDLNARFVGELQTAQQKLADTVSSLPASGSSLPFRPFQGALPWPVDGRVVARFGRDRGSRFGTAITRNGVEIGSAAGTAVAAVHEGSVAYAGPFTGYGNLVILDHGGHAYTLYGYLAAVDVTKGARVTDGGRVGRVGADPAGQPGLYFEVRIDGKAVDPLQWLKPRP
jgi:septal ring factor EnvC (AmiA/AmiB activator)